MSYEIQEDEPEHDQERAEENFRRLEDAILGAQPPKRQPNLGYALPLILSAYLFLSLTAIALIAIGTSTGFLPKDAVQHVHDLHKIAILSMALGYVVAFGWTYFVYPRFWHRTYFDVVQWNFGAVRQYWKQIVFGGIGLSLAVAMSERFISLPDQTPMDAFFRNPLDVWMVTIFGSTLAPFFEELVFRGYLLPGIAIAFDWLRMERTDAARAHWESTDTVSTQAILFSGFVTGLLFAGLHADQLAHAWGAVFLLFCVSCVLTAVRVRLRSLAASTLLHSMYNSTLFAALFIGTGGFRHLEQIHK